jgi:hypothetical protein
MPRPSSSTAINIISFSARRAEIFIRDPAGEYFATLSIN